MDSKYTIFRLLFVLSVTKLTLGLTLGKCSPVEKTRKNYARLHVVILFFVWKSQIVLNHYVIYHIPIAMHALIHCVITKYTFSYRKLLKNPLQSIVSHIFTVTDG